MILVIAALPASCLDQRRRDLAEQSFHEAREFGLASRAQFTRGVSASNRLGWRFLDRRVMLGLAPSLIRTGESLGAHRPRRASSAGFQVENAARSPISKRDAAGSVIHAGRQAKEPSGWSTTTNSTPPRLSRRLICIHFAEARMKSVGDACLSRLFAGSM